MGSIGRILIGIFSKKTVRTCCFGCFFVFAWRVVCGIMPFLVDFLPFGGLLSAGWYISLPCVKKTA